jgi:hypothetical protein
MSIHNELTAGLMLSAATLLTAAAAQAQDLGDAPPPVDRQIEYSPYPEEDSPATSTSATRTCTPPTRPMPA